MRHHLGVREAVSMMVIFLTAKVFLHFPRDLAEQGSSAGWMIALLGVIIGSLGWFFVDRLLRRHPGRTLAGATLEALGPLAGTVANLIYAGWFFCLTFLVLRQISEAVVGTALPRTPLQAMLAAILLTVAYSTSFGIEAISRVAAFFGPFLLLGFLALLAGGLFTHHEPYALAPVWGPGVPTLVKWGLVTTSTVSELLIFGLLAPAFRERQQLLRAVRWSLLLAGALQLLTILVWLTVFPYPAAARLTFPLLAVSRLVVAGRWIQRIEALFLLTWLVCAVVKLSVGLYAATATVAETLRLPTYRPLLPAISLLIYACAMLPPSLIHAEWWDRVLVRQYGGLISIGLPALTWLVSLLRRAPRMRAGALLLVPCLLLLSGCWDRTDPEHLVYVSMIGVDKGPANDYIFTFQMPRPRAITGGGNTGGGGGGGGGGAGKEGASMEAFSVEAPDVTTAMMVSDAFVARRPTIAHARAIVFGEDLAREGLAAVVSHATRFREFRRTMNVMVARGTARDFLLAAQPRREADPNLWLENVLQDQLRNGLIPPARIHEFVTDMEMIGRGSQAVLVAPHQEQPEAQPTGAGEGGTGPPPRAAAMIAGETRRLGEIPVDFLGTAVFQKDKLVGMLTGDETRLIRMVRGGLNRTPMALVDPADPTRRVTVTLRNQASPVIAVSRSGRRVSGTVALALEAELFAIQSGVDYSHEPGLSRLEASVERQLKRSLEELLRKTVTEWGVDLVGFTPRLRRTFATQTDWEAFDWGRAIPQLNYSVQVHVTIRRYGMQLAPVQPRW